MNLEKMAEWSSPYNPFNSMKALVHADRFEAILEGKPKPPLVVNFDLTNKCNYDCCFCMFANRERTDSSGKNFRGNKAELPKGYALQLPKLWKKWGVKASCLAGGGEPTLHPDCLELLKEYKKNDIELGFVTNGYLVNNEKWWETVCKSCKFIGFSIDAGNKEDYAKTKGVKPEAFDKVIDNIRNLAKTKERLNSDVQIGYKYVLDENNWKHIYEAAKIAKDIGVNHFQFRPAIHQNPEIFGRDLKQIKRQITYAQGRFEREDYKVMGIMHKFNQDLTKKHDFEKCRATILTTTWCADGNVYLCTDTRGNHWAKLGEHYPNPKKFIKFWGSKKHKDIVKKIDHRKCDRCTLGPYNEMFEQVFIQDKMDMNLI